MPNINTHMHIVNNNRKTNIKEKFINLCLQYNIIQFGDFTLKSGRQSPYFYNFGAFNCGDAIKQLGLLYAQLIIENKIDCDVIFAPAYKGIPIVIATVIALQQAYNINKAYCFNRKLIKTHGETGALVGADLQGKVLILDDVITSGISVEESIHLIHNHNGKVTAAITSLDRQEKYTNAIPTSTVAALEKKYAIKISSLANLEDLIEFISTDAKYRQYLDKIKIYQEQYCILTTL